MRRYGPKCVNPRAHPPPAREPRHGHHLSVAPVVLSLPGCDGRPGARPCRCGAWCGAGRRRDPRRHDARFGGRAADPRPERFVRRDERRHAGRRLVHVHPLRLGTVVRHDLLELLRHHTRAVDVGRPVPDHERRLPHLLQLAGGRAARRRDDLPARAGWLGGWVGDQGTTMITATFIPQPPTAPQDLQVVAGDTTAVVTWNPPLDPAGDLLSYTLLCTPDGGTEAACGQNLAPAPGESPATSFTFTGLTNGATYSVPVIAENIVGYSAPSGSATVTPQAPSVTTVWTEPTPLA